MSNEIPSHESQNEEKRSHIYKKSFKKSKFETIKFRSTEKKQIWIRILFFPKLNVIPRRWRAKSIVRHDVRRNINIDDIPHWSMIPLCNWENKYYLSTHIHWVISATYSFIYFGHVVPSIVQKTQIMDTVYDQFWSKHENNIIWIV